MKLEKLLSQLPQIIKDRLLIKLLSEHYPDRSIKMIKEIIREIKNEVQKETSSY